MILVYGSQWFHRDSGVTESSLGYVFMCVFQQCSGFAAGWTHMPQEIEPQDQGSPLGASSST